MGSEERSFEDWIDKANEVLNPWEAAQCFEEALKICPTHHVAWNLLGQTYYCLNEYDKAIDCLKEAISLSTDGAPAAYHKWIGLAYFAAGCHQSALDAYEKALGKGTKDADTLVKRGHALFYLDRLEDASNSYRAALDIEPQNTEAFEAFRRNNCFLLMERGNELFDQKDYESAAKCYHKSYRILKIIGKS